MGNRQVFFRPVEGVSIESTSCEPLQDGSYRLMFPRNPRECILTAKTSPFAFPPKNMFQELAKRFSAEGDCNTVLRLYNHEGHEGLEATYFVGTDKLQYERADGFTIDLLDRWSLYSMPAPLRLYLEGGTRDKRDFARLMGALEAFTGGAFHDFDFETFRITLEGSAGRTSQDPRDAIVSYTEYGNLLSVSMPYGSMLWQRHLGPHGGDKNPTGAEIREARVTAFEKLFGGYLFETCGPGTQEVVSPIDKLVGQIQEYQIDFQKQAGSSQV